MAILGKQIDFMKHAKLFGFVSITAVLISIGSLVFNSLQFGLDFTAGTLVEVGYSQPVAISEVSEKLRAGGYEDAQAVAFGSDQDVLIRLPVDDSVTEEEMAGTLVSLGNDILAALSQGSSAQLTLNRLEFVGPRVGEELAESGGMGLLVALGIVMIYVAVRFQSKFAVAAVIALFHDVIITLGIFSITGMEFDLTVLAALLAIIGYSINDTIVVFDRIRENFRVMRKGTPYELINLSLSQTLSRTIITAGTTQLVVCAMLFMGGESIQGFATALTLGIVIGTYSSIYIASSLLLYLKVTKEDLMVPVREGAQDSMP
ncbi:MAG: protein translocase subunit SecF [Pseudomonadales bacterium]|nr:protein translocase subunit SecF [Pseudomonadales bacterium]MCP5343158.1 protein translocase subunit SecF [Pseudomonadales bacterium]